MASMWNLLIARYWLVQQKQGTIFEIDELTAKPEQFITPGPNFEASREVSHGDINFTINEQSNDINNDEANASPEQSIPNGVGRMTIPIPEGQTER